MNKISREISFEDVQIATTLLTQCTSNILNVNFPIFQNFDIYSFYRLSIHGPVQERTVNEKLTTNQHEIIEQIDETLILITSSLSHHLNFRQSFIMNTPEVLMLSERTSINLLSNKTIENIRINFRLNFNNQHQDILFRLKLDALAPFGNSRAYTNLSRALALSILHPNGTKISIKTKDFIELIIPRDPNLILPEMILQDVLSHHQSFYYKFIDLKNLQTNPNLTISVHFQIQSSDGSLGYLFIISHSFVL